MLILILKGMKRTGTSHLLLSERQVGEMVRAYRKPFPHRSMRALELESLSPVYFHSKEDFQQTFGRLKIKHTKGRTPWDNSQENKAFSTSDQHRERGAFEHGRYVQSPTIYMPTFSQLFHARLFYHILGRKEKIDPQKFYVHDSSWTDLVQIFSFAMSLRSPDTRPSQDRIDHPIALDCGLAQASLDLSYHEASATHYSFYNNRMLGAGSPKLVNENYFCFLHCHPDHIFLSSLFSMVKQKNLMT